MKSYRLVLLVRILFSLWVLNLNPDLQVIYLLLDVMYSLPNKSGASVESFPTAFSIPMGLVKLVQGLWLLDHHDHEVSCCLLAVYTVFFFSCSIIECKNCSLSLSELSGPAPPPIGLSLCVGMAALSGSAGSDDSEQTQHSTALPAHDEALHHLHPPH